MGLNKSLFSSDRMDWPTPKFLFRALDAEFHFTLDACASKRNAKCKKFFTIKDNGLSKKWRGNVWVNPPYGREISKWVKKARRQVRKGYADVVVCLVPVRTDSMWWHENCMRASEVRLLDQRLEFEGSTNKAPFPTALIIFRRGHKGGPRLTALKVRPLRTKG
jgi:site-specific DNA-methyltransferase (adenine-specific)